MKGLSLEEIQKKLAEPFHEDEIKWRVVHSFRTQKNGQMYAYVAPYIESRTVMNRLDSVLGVDNWENDYKELHNGILCGIRIHLPGGKTIVKYDGSDLTEFEELKGGISGAFKRAAVLFGIGRYLYNLNEIMITIFPDTKQGEKYINDKKKNIVGSWDPPALPNWALPNGNQTQRGQKSKQVNQDRGNQPPNNNNQSDQGGEVSRETLNKSILKLETTIGLNKSPDYIVRIFNKANNSQVDSLNLVRTASEQQLKSYYFALKPVYQLVAVQKHYKFVEEEFLKLVQTIVVETVIENLYSCFFKVTAEQVKKIEKLARDTYEQRRLAS